MGHVGSPWIIDVRPSREARLREEEKFPDAANPSAIHAQCGIRAPYRISQARSTGRPFPDAALAALSIPCVLNRRIFLGIPRLYVSTPDTHPFMDKIERMNTLSISTPLLKNKHAVIFGAGGAVGAAVAKEFAAQGATVYLSGRTLNNVEQVTQEIRQDGGIA